MKYLISAIDFVLGVEVLNDNLRDDMIIINSKLEIIIMTLK